MQKVEICGVDTSGLPKLTAQENETLMRELKAGDAQAREKFIENGHQCTPLYLQPKIFPAEIGLPYSVPESGVIFLAVCHNPVKIKQKRLCSHCLFH